MPFIELLWLKTALVITCILKKMVYQYAFPLPTVLEQRQLIILFTCLSGQERQTLNAFNEANFAPRGSSLTSYFKAVVIPSSAPLNAKMNGINTENFNGVI